MVCLPAHLRKKNFLGYTLIELMVVMAVMAMITGIGWYGFRSYSYQTQLSDSQRNLTSRLLAARNEALAGVLVGGSPIHYAQFVVSSQYIIDGQNFNVGENVEISDISPAKAIIFYFFHPSQKEDEESCPECCHFACDLTDFSNPIPIDGDIRITFQHRLTLARKCLKVEGQGLRINRIYEFDCP